MGDPFGHLKVSRKSFLPAEAGGDPFWNEKREFSRWEAWVYLLQSAAFTDHKRSVDGHMIEIPRGHTPPLALSYLAEAWGWSVKRVRTFLAAVIETDRIRAVSGARSGTVYLILNYDFYQSAGTEKGTLGAGSGHARGRNKKKEKQEKQGEREHRLPPDWGPTPEHVAYCAENRVDLAAEVEKFKLWAEQKAARKANWNAAFAGWIRREWVKRLNGKGHVEQVATWDESTMGRFE